MKPNIYNGVSSIQESLFALAAQINGCREELKLLPTTTRLQQAETFLRTAMQCVEEEEKERSKKAR